MHQPPGCATIALVCVALAVAYSPGCALAQAGSAGGSIGKQGKSVSGDDSSRPPAPSRPAARSGGGAAGSRSAAKPKEDEGGCGRIAGSWSWKFGIFDPVGVIFKADGTGAATNGLTSTYKCSGGMYTVSWSHGFVDHMTLSSDGRQLNGNGAFGIGIAATRR
jgi:hypothetical protein